MGHIYRVMGSPHVDYVDVFEDGLVVLFREEFFAPFPGDWPVHQV